MLNKKMKIIILVGVSLFVLGGGISMYLTQREAFSRGESKAYYEAVMMIEDINKDLYDTSSAILMKVEKAKTILPTNNHRFTLIYYPDSVNHLRGYINGSEKVLNIIKESRIYENKNTLNQDHIIRAMILFKIIEEQIKL